MAVEKPNVFKLAGGWDTPTLLAALYAQLLADPNWGVSNAITIVDPGDGGFTCSPAGQDWEANFFDPSAGAGIFSVCLAPDGGIAAANNATATANASAEGQCSPLAVGTADLASEVLCLVFDDMICLLFQSHTNTQFRAVLTIGQVVNIWSTEMVADNIDGLGYFFGKPHCGVGLEDGNAFISFTASSGAKRQLRVGEDVWIGNSSYDINRMTDSMSFHAGGPQAINTKHYMRPLICLIGGYTTYANDPRYGGWNEIGLFNHMGRGRTTAHYGNTTPFAAKDRVAASDGVEWLFVYNASVAVRNYGEDAFFIPWDDAQVP